jgi:hypothetical protein
MDVVHTVTSHQIPKKCSEFLYYEVTQQVNWLELPVVMFTLLNT